MLERFKIALIDALRKFARLCIKGEEKAISAIKSRPQVDYSEDRKYVSALIIQALTDRLIVREALLKFPKDIDDPSIAAAWHALCHYEADENIRNRDKEYAEEQNDYLEMIAFTLKKGETLPENIINSYRKYHQTALTPNSVGIKGIIAELKRLINL